MTISLGVEYDYMRRRIARGNKSYGIDTLTLISQSIARQVQEKIADSSEAPSNNSIMVEFCLAHEHLVFK